MNDMDAKLHALHWAFFSSVMDKSFPDLFAEFVTWCDSLSKEEMDDIMTLADDDTEDSEEEKTTHTEAEIWKSLSVN